MTTFHAMDAIGNWKQLYPAYNTLEVDEVDYVEGTGSIKFTFSTDEEALNWGDYFYIRPESGYFNFSTEPMLRFRIKANAELPALLHINIVTDMSDYGGEAWVSSTWLLAAEITEIGEWLTVVIDTRIATGGEEHPNLAKIRQFAFISAAYIPYPGPSFNVDYIETIAGDPMGLVGSVDPAEAYTIEDKAATFTAHPRYGTPPYAYAWYVDTVLQEEETASTFEHTESTADLYAVRCIMTDDDVGEVIEDCSLRVVAPFAVTPTQNPLHMSDIRAMFFHMIDWTGKPDDWDVVAETCKDYGMNLIILETYPRHLSDGVDVIDCAWLHTAVTAFHAVGLPVHVLLTLLAGETFDESLRAIEYEGMTTSDDTLCFLKAKTVLDDIATSLATNYDIEGFMFDYTRWQHREMCYCPTCQARFKADTGLTDAVFPTDVLVSPEGKYYWDFIEWRQKPVTEALTSMRAIMRAINPDISISAATWIFYGYDEGSSTPNLIYYGQHAGDWVDKGLLDWAAPMCYETTLGPEGGPGGVNFYMTTDRSRYWTVGGIIGWDEKKVVIKGKIPCPLFLWQITQTAIGPDEYVEFMQVARASGAEGWCIWRYGGPSIENFEDFRPYICAMSVAGLMPPVWAITDLSVSIGETNTIVSWNTSVSTTSQIEYGDEIYIGVERLDGQIPYMQVVYDGGTIVAEEAPTTSHYFSVPNSNEIFIKSSNAKDGLAIQLKIEGEVTPSEESEDIPTNSTKGMNGTVFSLMSRSRLGALIY